MKTKFSFILPLSIFTLLTCKGPMPKAPIYKQHSIIGTWKYGWCTIKNTSVRGTLTFKTDGTFDLDARARDDHPTPSIRGNYKYSISGNRITTDYKKGYGLIKYYFIKGKYMYFSSRPITNVIKKWVGNYMRANWQHELKRVEKK